MWKGEWSESTFCEHCSEVNLRLSICVSIKADKVNEIYPITAGVPPYLLLTGIISSEHSHSFHMH